MATAIVSQEEVLHWLALRLVPGLGTVGSLKLLEKLKSPQAIFRASASELEGAGMSPAQARNIASGCSFEDAVDQQQKMINAGAQLISIHDARYPRRLREIFDPPILLFALGRTDLMPTASIGVVGTRNPTPYGMAAAERLSADLARAGLTIVSGMARGIDTAAHQATLKENADTIAVLGCGVDVVTLPPTADSTTRLPRKVCCLRIPHVCAGVSAKFSNSQQDCQRFIYRRTDRGGRAIQRIGDHREAGDGSGQGSFCSARQRYFKDELGS